MSGVRLFSTLANILAITPKEQTHSHLFSITVNLLKIVQRRKCTTELHKAAIQTGIIVNYLSTLS